jgi:protein-disulfide isomerase
VTLVEYGDYECDYCRQAYPVVSQLLRRFKDRVRFVYRHFPLAQIHPHAQRAAECAEAAGAQDRFWEMHDRLFTHPGALEDSVLVEYADQLGLDVPRFLRDLTSHVNTLRVREDFQSAVNSGANRTPTFFINGVRDDGLWEMNRLTKAIRDAVRERHPR